MLLVECDDGDDDDGDDGTWGEVFVLLKCGGLGWDRRA